MYLKKIVNNTNWDLTVNSLNGLYLERYIKCVWKLTIRHVNFDARPYHKLEKKE